MQKIDNILNIPPETDNIKKRPQLCGTTRLLDVMHRKMFGIRKHGGTTLYCSNEYYAREAGLSVRQVQRNKVKLVALNLIKIIPQFKNGKQLTSKIVFTAKGFKEYGIEKTRGFLRTCKEKIGGKGGVTSVSHKGSLREQYRNKEGNFVVLGYEKGKTLGAYYKSAQVFLREKRLQPLTA